MNGRPWTQEELDRLRELAAEKLSPQQVAEALKRTRGSIAAKAFELGIPFIDRRTGEPRNMPARNAARRERKNAEQRLAELKPQSVKVKQRPLARGVDWAV